MMEKLFHTIFWSSVQAAHTQAPRPDLSEFKSIGKVGGLITQCILSLSLSLCVVALPYYKPLFAPNLALVIVATTSWSC